VTEGENGFFYPPEDAASLAQGIVQAKALQFDGYGYVKKHFSLDQMVEKTINVYKELL
jgi:glycosyltransferase involved in cell wall biosynthesis